MKCDFCDAEATIHLTKVVDSVAQKLHLCVACAKEKGYSEEATFSVSDILMGPELGAGAGKEKACQTCGLTLRRLKKRGRLGCPDCYDRFTSHLEDVFESMHHAQRHVGRGPARAWAAQAKRHELEGLEADLQQAIDDEDFEMAAELRDLIREQAPGELL